MKPTPLDYAAPAMPSLRPWVGARRLGLFVVASLGYFGLGLVALTLSTGGPFFRAASSVWLFPFGLLTNLINPHRSADGAVGNSLFWGYVLAYAFAWWRNRRLKA